MRSIVPRLENPRASARRAHSSSSSRPTPAIVAGRPMPTSIARPPVFNRSEIEKPRHRVAPSMTAMANKQAAEKRFTDEERAAMKERVREQKKAGKADGESDVLEKI